MSQSRAWAKSAAHRDGQEEDLIDGMEDGDQAVGEQAPADQGAASQLDRVSMSTSMRQVVDADKPVYTSQWATLFIIVNVTVGVGLLAMPFAMQTAGVVTSIVLQLFFLSQIIITCIMCIELTVKSEVASYHEIVQRHCHKYVYQFSQLSIFLIVFGAVVAYIVTIGDQADRLFATLYGSHFCDSWYMDRRFIMSFTTLVAIKPLCSARTVDFLKYASFLGIISIGFILYVVIENFAEEDKIRADVNYYPKSWADIAFILPVFCLAYQCHLSLVPTVATIHRRQKPKAFVTSTIAMIIAMIIYSAVSVLAVLTFGSTIKEDLTESFKGTGFCTTASIAIVGLKCVLTLPAAYLPARLSIVDILTNNWARFAAFSEPVRRVGVTLIFLDAALLTAIYMPNILVVVNLLGCLAVMFIFILPGMAYLSLVKQNRLEKQRADGRDSEVPEYTAKDKMKRCSSYFMIVFGLLMTVVVLYKSIDGIIHNKPSAPLCIRT